MQMTYQEPSAAFGKSVIIGGGIAGLVAAHVLSNYFSEVIVLERGQYPTDPVFRKETPQARHRHSISDAGRQVFGEMFPDLDNALEAAGCPSVANMRMDTCHNVDYVVTKAIDVSSDNNSSLKKRLVSRPRIEWEIRQRISRIKNVQIVQECQVQGLLPSVEKREIEGVIARIKGQVHHFQADLVIEASGRHSKIIHWLDAVPSQPPPESVLESKLIMVGCQYELPPNFSPDWVTLFIQSRPPHNFREAFLSLIEDKYLLLTVSGLQGHYPPTKNYELLNYLKQLRKSGIYDIVKNLKPLGSPYGCGHTQNRRRHFEKSIDFPDKLIVMGDAACCLNPAYGFGMEAAAQAGDALQKVLKQQEKIGSLIGVSNRFHGVLAETLDATWQKVTGMDKSYLEETAAFSSISVPSRLPLEQEPHINAWCDYASDAKQVGGFKAIRQRLVQLQFPIQTGIYATNAYRDATRRGLSIDSVTANVLMLDEPAALKVDVYKGVVGDVPILQTGNRADFEKLVQALAKRNEPVPIPRFVSLYFISGFNNWDRIRTYKANWIKGKEVEHLDKNGWEQEWEGEFKKLSVQKSLYQDCFVVSENWIQEVPASELGQSGQAWQRLSSIIHNEYAATHYFLARWGLSKRNLPIHNELIAYYVGLIMAIGEFRKNWFLRFMSPHISLENKYLLEHAAEHVAKFDQKYGCDFRDPDGLALMIYALDSLSFEELVADSAICQLGDALERLMHQKSK